MVNQHHFTRGNDIWRAHEWWREEAATGRSRAAWTRLTPLLHVDLRCRLQGWVEVESMLKMLSMIHYV